MSDTKFDPYHVWLGIPPKDQPPNLYRLLGLELYESDPTVIDAAANRQNSYLHEMAAGPNRRQSQELLNEIAAARRRLLDANRKNKYDEKLKTRLAEKEASEQKANGVPVPLPDTPPGAEPEAKKHKQAAEQNSVTGAIKKKEAANSAKFQVIAGAAGLIILIGIAWAVVGKSGDEESQGDSTAGTERSAGKENTGEDKPGTEEAGTSGTDPVDEHLLAHWAFDDPSADLSSVSEPNAMPATLQGNPVVAQDGPIGSYLQLDGKDDRMSLPATAVNLSEGAFATWIRIQDPPERVSTLVFRFRVENAGLDIRRGKDGAIRVGSPAQQWNLTGTQQVPQGEWVHLAMTWSATAPAALFLNGKPAGTSAAPLKMTSCRGVLAGLSPSGGGKKKQEQIFHKVAFDDLRFYSQPLDEAKILKLVSASIVTPKTLEPYEGEKPPQYSLGANGLIAEYLFEDATKPELDKFGNASGTNHGTKVIDDATYGKVLDLDGKSHAEVPRIVSNDFTISFWMKASPDQAAAPDDIGLIDASVSGNAADFRSMLKKGLVTFEIGDPNEKAKKVIQSKKLVTDGNWHYIAMSRAAGSGKFWLYVDGELQSSADGPKGSRKASPSMRIGRIRNDSRSFKGQLAALRIHQQVVPHDVINKLGGEPLAAMFEANRQAHASAIAAKIEEIKSTPIGKNQILCEYWKNIPGKPIKPVKDKVRAKVTPDGVRFLNRLATDKSNSLGDNYGQRISGYLLAPKTGSYAFEALFDDSGEFLLSTSIQPKDLKPVKEARQLQAGQAYYFQVYHKEEVGDDSFTINWTVPAEKKAVITGTHLTSIPSYHRFAWLTPASATSGSNAVKLKINNDKSILVSGQNRDGLYTIDLMPGVSDLTCVKLEILPDPSLPGGGPGMGARGMFAIQEIGLAIVEGDRVSKVDMSEPASREGVPKSAADGDEKTEWSVRRPSRSESPQAVSLFLTPVSPIRINSGAKLRFTIRQSTNIGRFRFSGTAMDAPTLAAEIARASVPAQRAPKEKIKPLLVNLNGHTIENPKTKERWVSGREFKGAAAWGYKGGSPIGNKNDKSSTLPNAIQGIQSFHAKVENGAYTVTLYFTDLWANNPGERQFTVQIEKPSIGGQIDPIFRGGGKGKPSSLSRVVRVEDGKVDILFTKVKGEPILNAISIVPK